MQHIIIKVFRMSVFGFYKRILHQTLLQLQRVLDVVVPSLFHLVSFWLETDIQSVFRTSVEKHQCSKCAIVTINRRYVYICHVHHGLWGHSDQLCGHIVYIYSPCCNWTSLCCSRMRLCDWRQCDCCSTYFQLKTFGYFTGEYTLWYKVIRCPWMLVYCGCRHS